MFALTKSHVLSLFIAISVSICASKNIGNQSDLDPRIFFFPRGADSMQYSKLSDLGKSKLFWTYNYFTMAMDYYSEEKMLFWTSNSGELYSALLNDDVLRNESDEIIQEVRINITLLRSEKNWKPRSIALDEVGKKLYIVDTFERSIDVFDLNGQNKTRLFTNRHVIPCEIVIDSNEGLLFLYAINFVKRRTELHRMNMDGSDHRIIIDNIENVKYSGLKVKDSLAIDRMNKQLYYRSSSESISTADYNGNGRGLILTYEELYHFEIYNSSLYWSKSMEDAEVIENFGHIKFGMILENKTYPLRSCELNKRILTNASSLCDPIWENHLAIDFFNMFKIFDIAPTKKPVNPCAEAKNGCEDHCLLKPSGTDEKLSYGCACRLDRKMNDDGKTCSDVEQEKIDEELSTTVYEDVWYLYHERPNNFTKIEISRYLFDKISKGGPGIVWDNILNTKYEVDYDGKIIKNQNDVPSITLRNSSENIARVLSYDWVSKNLYYAKLSNDSEKYNLFVVPTVYPEKEIFLAQIDKPTSMAVHPYRGYLFIATFNKDKNESRIVRLNTNGEDRLLLPYSNYSKIMLTLDMDEDKLYWTDECSEENKVCIRNANLDGNDSNLLKSSNFNLHSDMILIYQDKIYIDTMREFYILKKTGEEYIYLEGLDYYLLKNAILTKGEVKKTYTQYFSVKNPCVHDNGGCEVFCFAVPKNNSKNLEKVCSG